jgi:microcystin-dependent protein
MTIPIPAPTALEEPTTCVRINELWIPVLLGALQHYLNPPQWELGQRGPYMVNPDPVWEGDATDNEDAEQQILEIMAALMAGNCEETPVTIPTGTIQMYVGNVAPIGWLICNGGNYYKEGYPALYAVLGSNFDDAGDPEIFRLPNLQGRSPIGFDGATFSPIGASQGSLTHTLDVNEMPVHSHVQNAHAHGMQAGLNATGIGNSGILAMTNATGTTVVIGSGWPATAANQNVGGGLAHNNLHPVTVINFIIKT